MLTKRRLSPEEKAYILFLRRQSKLSFRKIAAICRCSPSTVHKIVKTPIATYRHSVPNRTVLQGRPRKIDERKGRLLIRALYKLRKTEGNFTVKRIITEAGLSQSDVSERTVSRFLNKQGFHFLVSRKKGLITERDMKLRVKFARRMKRDYPQNVWTRRVAFYLDGVSFVHKTRPLDQATAPKGKIWRKKCEGLEPGCTSKGSKSCSGGKQVKLIVGLSYNVGVVLCQQYDHLDGMFFASFVEKHFKQTFLNARKGNTRLWLQDGDPSQNSAVAYKAMKNINAELLKIPPRSPDLNPCENFFKIVVDALRERAITNKIERESYKDFSERVIDTIYSIPIAQINKLISSMNRRIDAIISNKGKRLKY